MYKGGTYLALGDSITWGSTLDWGTAYVTYAGKIVKAVNDKYGRCKMINKAISGWKSADFLTSPHYWSRINADLVSIHIGTNDCGNSIPTATFQTNLESVVDVIKKNNPQVEIILCSISRRNDMGANALDPYRAVVQNVATSRKTLFCKLEDAWLQSETTTYTADGLHPNALGHQKLFDVLFPVVEQSNFVKNIKRG